MCRQIIPIALFIALLIRFSSNATACETTFEAILQRHTNAIDSRDLEVYLSTIAPRNEQLMILPDGSKWISIEEIRDGHKQWFKDTTWAFNKSLIRKDVRPTWGIAVYQASVDRPDKPGMPFLLSMMFAPEEDGCWYLQHDQNTLLTR